MIATTVNASGTFIFSPNRASVASWKVYNGALKSPLPPALDNDLAFSEWPIAVYHPRNLKCTSHKCYITM